MRSELIGASDDENESHVSIEPGMAGAPNRLTRSTGEQHLADQRYPAAFAQQRLWILQSLEPTGTAYNLTAGFRVIGNLDIAALSRAATAICLRHEALRTRFAQVDGSVFQVVAAAGSPRAAPEFTCTSLDIGGAQDAGAACEDFLADAMAVPFDLESGPLLRIKVGTLGAEDHTVVIVSHHIVCDGWSMGVVLADLSSLYRAQLLGTAEPPQPECQSADYALWERKTLDPERITECLGYWTDHLAGAQTVLALPADRPRQPTAFPESGVYAFAVPSAVARGLRDLSIKSKASLSIVLLAAFYAFLARITGELDVVVGYPVSMRTQQGTESMVGMLVNTLALRCDMRDDPTFLQLLHRVRVSALDGQQYADLPFERLVEEINPDRVLGINPLVQVMFQLLEERFSTRLSLEGARTTPTSATQPTTFVDLALDMYCEGEDLRASFNYRRDQFDFRTVVRFSDCLLTLLAAAVKDPAVRISGLPVMTAAETARIVARFGHGPRVAVPPGATILSAFEEQVAKRPDDTALADAERQWTFRELSVEIDAVAAELRSRGIARGDCVGLMVERSGLLPTAILGILRSGAVLVPLDSANPPERSRAMVREARVRLVVVGRRTRGKAEELSVPLVRLSATSPQQRRTPPPRVVPRPEDPAYVVFTSGSTAIPKGVLVQHGALANLYYSHRNGHYAEVAGKVAGRRLRVAYTMSVAFDASWDQLLWMVDGNLLYVVDDDTARDAWQLITCLREQRIDVLESTPSLLEQLVGLGLLDGEERYPWAYMIGGEAVRPSLWSRLASEPGVSAVNLYGPTEFTVDALCAQVAGDSGPLVGRALANCRVLLLDNCGRPVPIGVAGEICLAGPQLASGYVNDPVRTAECFVPDSFGPEPGARMYRTGDLGRFRAGGEVEFAGRVDGQLKIRGYRVEPGEVESVLLAHPQVNDAAAVAHPDALGQPQLIAYVVPKGAVTTSRLLDHLADRLPDYMVPVAVILMDEIPRLVGGKVAAARLPAPDASAIQAPFIPPLDGAEQGLAEIFGAVLRQQGVGRFDNFFRLGGHSLLAVQLISRIRAVMGVDLSLRTLFENPTVAALGAAVRSATSSDQPPIPTLTQRGSTPASSAQQGVWFRQHIASQNTSYNMVEAIRLKGRLDLDALSKSIRQVVARHDVLRTRYTLGDSSLLQSVDPDWGCDVAFVDLSVLPSTQAQERAVAFVRQMAERNYDLQFGSLFEAAVLRLEPEDHILVLGAHHIVCDGWSVKLLLSELSAHYGDFAAHRACNIPALRIQYQDFAAWERSPDHEERLADHLAYWRDQLAGAPGELGLPTDRPRPDVHSGSGGTIVFRVAPDVTSALTELGRHHKTTLFTTLLAAFQAVLSRCTGERDLIVGVPVAGRTTIELESLIGLFVNILPIRANLHGDPPFEEFLGQVWETTLSGYTHQALSFERLVQLVNPTRDLGRNPLVQATCQLFEEGGASGLELEGVAADPFKVDIPSSRFDLSLDLTREGGGLSGELCYDADVFDRATVDGLAASFLAVLKEVCLDPTQRISEMRLRDVFDRESTHVPTTRDPAPG